MNYIDNVRRNHALEHATVSLLLGKLGPQIRVIGRASHNGFFIYGDFPADLVAECAHEGLARLQHGEAYWAVTPHCGTNIATAGILAGLSAAAVLGNAGHRRENLGNAMVAGMLAVTISQPIGRMIQRRFTTSADLAGTEIIAIETKPSGRYHKIKTRRLASAA